LLALIARVRAVRIARLPDVTITIGEIQTHPSANVRSVPLPDPWYPTIAVWDAEGDWAELQACAPALAHLLGQPYLHDALELALMKLERLLADAPPDRMEASLLARAFDTTPARVAELRQALEGDVDHVKRRLRPVVAHLTDLDYRDRAIDAVDGCASEEALARLLAPHAADLAVAPNDAVVLARLASGMDELRDGLGLPFAAFNETLAALGPPYAPLTHPDLHEAAFAGYVGELADRILDRLRERYLPLAERNGEAHAYAAARTLEGLEPDLAWLPVYRVPTPDLMRARVGQWLRGHGASDDLDAPPVLPPVADLRTRNADRLDAVVARAVPVVLAWCRSRGSAPPLGWVGTPRVEAQFALDASGLADHIQLADNALLRAAADGVGWPEGMDLTVDATALGLREADLALLPGNGAPGRRGAAARTIRVGTLDLPVGNDNLARISEAALQTVDPGFLNQTGKASLSELSSAPGNARGGGPGGTVVVRNAGMTEDQRAAVGLVGEIAARAWLSQRYRDVRWRSGYAAIVSGDPEASDSYGYDFEVAWRNTTLMFEVKALSGEPSGLAEFEMGESEVRAAQAAARGDRYRILLVTAALDPADRRIHVLPNPFSARGHGLFRVAGRGLRYQCALG
jgi:hypothetical protein